MWRVGGEYLPFTEEILRREAATLVRDVKEGLTA